MINDDMDDMNNIDNVNINKYSLINKLNVSENIKTELINLNNTYNYVDYKEHRYNINFIVYTCSSIKILCGSIINEINVMCHLTKIANVYYNDNLINNFVNKNYELDINRLNNSINKRIIRTRMDKFFKSYYGIFIPTIKYDVIFYRSNNTQQNKNLFKMLPDPKIFSHNYDEDIWKNNIIGFQTEIARDLANKKLLSFIEDDETLGYYKKNMIIPYKSFIRYQFINIIKTSGLVKQTINEIYNSKFIIGVIGIINKFTSINNLVDIIELIREKYEELNIILIILTTEIYEKIPEKKWIIIMNKPRHEYFNILSQINVCVNTWNNNVIIYSASNKNLDCISVNVPVIIPYSISYAEIFGYDYPLFYSYENVKNDITDLIVSVLEKKYDVSELYEKIRNTYNCSIYEKYKKQIYNLLI